MIAVLPVALASVAKAWAVGIAEYQVKGAAETTGGLTGFELQAYYIRHTGSGSRRCQINAVLLPQGLGIRKPTASTALTVASYNEFRKATKSAISFAFSPIWKR